MAPLRRRWDAVRTEADALKAAWDAATTPQTRTNRRTVFAAALFTFQEELAAVRVLDPACGSGNFLYVALAALQDLEKAVVAYGTANGLPAMLPRVGPRQLHGLEINEYAHELAQVVVWIGYLQWMTANGFQVNRNPVLEPLATIRLQDALLDRSDPEHVKEAEWPEADVIIGNPPFLGGSKMRQELGGGYLADLWRVYDSRVSNASDFVVYFFEKARDHVATSLAKRAGLLATQGIRTKVNRRVIERIKETGDIFMAWSDEPWILNGAAVRISIIGFDDGSDTCRFLNGQPVQRINANLTSETDVTTSTLLSENAGIAFQGLQKGGAFDIDRDTAAAMLAQPLNPNGRRNGDVIKPWVNAIDVVGRNQQTYIIDFGTTATQDAAALYEKPFEYVQSAVRPVRTNNNRAAYRDRWWLHIEPRPALRAAIGDLDRAVATPRVSKHRLFVWLDQGVLPSNKLIAFARQDDYFFGVLHSRAHEVWSLAQGSRHGKGNDPVYTPSTCFETFPLPWSPGQEPWDDPRLHAIAEAARLLDERRRAWLDPAGATEAELKKRTLTNLYNARPTWLANLHTALDRAVWAAYGWDDPDPALTENDAILARLLVLNGERAAQAVGTPPLPPARRSAST